jgi:hypothetical protein
VSKDAKPRLIHVAFTMEPTSNHIAAVVEILPAPKVSPHESWDGCKGPVALNRRGPFDPHGEFLHTSPDTHSVQIYHLMPNTNLASPGQGFVKFSAASEPHGELGESWGGGNGRYQLSGWQYWLPYPGQVS